jgi:hypothetical protein
MLSSRHLKEEEEEAEEVDGTITSVHNPKIKTNGTIASMLSLGKQDTSGAITSARSPEEITDGAITGARSSGN